MALSGRRQSVNVHCFCPYNPVLGMNAGVHVATGDTKHTVPAIAAPTAAASVPPAAEPTAEPRPACASSSCRQTRSQAGVDCARTAASRRRRQPGSEQAAEPHTLVCSCVQRGPGEVHGLMLRCEMWDGCSGVRYPGHQLGAYVMIICDQLRVHFYVRACSSNA